MSKSEKDAAIIIQKWWRRFITRKKLVIDVRKEFESICASIGDYDPTWESPNMSSPKFPKNIESEKLWIQGSIANRMAELKYQQSLPKE